MRARVEKVTVLGWNKSYISIPFSCVCWEGYVVKYDDSYLDFQNYPDAQDAICPDLKVEAVVVIYVEFIHEEPYSLRSVLFLFI